MSASPKQDKTFIVRYTESIIKWRWLVVIGGLILTFLIGSGGQYLTFATNYRVFFGEDNQHLQAFEAMQNIYTKNDNILFTVEARDKDVFSADVLHAVEVLTEGAWQIPYSIRVDAVTNFQHTYSEKDDLVVEDLVTNASNQAEAVLVNARHVALNEPLIVNRLLSKNAAVTGINVTLQFPHKSITEVPEAVAAARKLAAEIESQNPSVRIYLTGVAMVNNAFSEASQNDLGTLMPVMYLAMIIIMYFFLRSVSGTIVTLLVITLSTMVAMGTAGWFGIALTPPSVQAPTIIMTLAIADCIHILVTMLHELRSGSSKREAIIESMRVNFQPILLTSVSTAIGFLSLNFSDVPPYNHLGNITSVGVMAAWFFSITFLPAFMAIVPLRVRQKNRKESDIFDRISSFVLQRQRPLLWASAAIIVLLAAFIPQNELDDRFVHYFDDSIQFRQDTDFTLNNMTGVYQIMYSLGGGESGSISEPAYLSKLEEFAIWLRQQEGVVHVSSLTDVMKRLNKNMHYDDASYFTIPANRELSAQYLLLYEMSLPYGLDLNNQINVDKSATRLVVTLGDLTSKQTLALNAKAEQWLASNAPDYMFAYGSSPTIMFSNISELAINSMLAGSVFALILISILMIFALRSLKIGLLSLFPNLVPVIMAFGIRGLLGGRVDMGLSVVIGMTMGIVVDDSVHFLSKYLRARREKGLSQEDAIRFAFSSVGRALVVTSVILIVGFAILSLSSFAMNGAMAQITAITIALALVADFFFLPPLLIALGGKRASGSTSRQDDISTSRIPLASEA